MTSPLGASQSLVRLSEAETPDASKKRYTLPSEVRKLDDAEGSVQFVVASFVISWLLTLIAGAVVVPVPLSWRVCGLPAALSLIDTDAVRVPPAAGVKVTEIVHCWFVARARFAEQVVVIAKSEAFCP